VGNRNETGNQGFKKKVERAKQIINNQIESDDPDTVEFIKDLFERFPEIDSMSQSAWNDRWARVAKLDFTKFVMTVVDKIVRELAEKL